MLLKILELNNVRSYIDEKIVFPSGSFLLAGSVGSGKSTILLAVEFALFGVLRGELSGASLLRHGCDRGFVALEFEIDGRSYRIGRFLRRVGSAVGQEAGFFQVGGVREDLSVVELKARVLGILGYPLSLASKGRNVLYRFTVYTPQEEMKRILLESADERVDVLRRLFLIDQYKRVQENARIVSRLFRERVKVLEGFTSDLDAKKVLLSSAEERLGVLLSKCSLAEESLKSSRERCAALRSRFDELLKSVELFRDAERRLLSLKDREVSLGNSLSRCSSRLEGLGGIPSDVSERVRVLEVEERLVVLDVEKFQSLMFQCAKDSAVARSKIESLKGAGVKVVNLYVCPVCLQKVSEEHKHRVRSENERECEVLHSGLKRSEVEESELVGRLSSSRARLDVLRRELSDMRVLAARGGERDRILLEREVLVGELSNTQKLIVELSDRVVKDREVLSLFERAKVEYDAGVLVERDAFSLVSSLRRECELVREHVSSLSCEVREKVVAREELVRRSAFSEWLSQHFVNVVESIERQVLSRVYYSLNSLFSEWFSLLVDDASLVARLDDSFSPVIVQNGFESSFEFLSGGERTACALAYRLALNRVVNEVVGSLRTKGLLLLDEPTEGFSSVQLERLRDVLSSLNLSQVGIVSHEGIVETFVDHVLRVWKGDRGSVVVKES